MNCAARPTPAAGAPTPRSANSVRLGAAKASARPSSRATAPWPTTTAAPGEALGATIAKVMPSTRFTPMTGESGLNASVTSNSGCGSAAARVAPRRPAAARSRPCSARATPRPRRAPVMPPNSPGVSGRPFASTTVAPAAARPVPTAAMRPPCTSTSVRSSVPRSVTVCTVALRISRSCAGAAAASAAAPSSSAQRRAGSDADHSAPPAGWPSRKSERGVAAGAARS